MPDILILPIPDETITDALLTLLDGFRAANLVTTCAPILVTTDDPHVIAILTRYGKLLPNGKTNGHPQPEPHPEPRPELAPQPDEDGEKGTETPTFFTNPLTGEIITLGSMRQLLRFKRLNPKERFISNKKGLMEVRDFGGKYKLSVVEE